MSSNTEKAMELARMVAARHQEFQRCVADSVSFALCEASLRKSEEALARHIEAMQRDCRTCAEFDGCRKVEPWHIRCKNHNQWQPVEFVQLTREE